MQTLVMTHGSRHAARWPELIRGCMAVTPVTTMQPFELRVSCVSASSRMSTVKRAYLPMYTSCAEGMHMSPAARGVNIGTRRKVPGHTVHSALPHAFFIFDPYVARDGLAVVWLWRLGHPL